MYLWVHVHLVHATQNQFFFQLTELPIVASLPPPSTTEALTNIRNLASTETSSPNATAEIQLQGILYSKIVSTAVVGLVIIVAIIVTAIIVLVVVIRRKKMRLPRNSTHSTDDVQRYGTTLSHSVDFTIKENIAYDAYTFEQSYACVEVQPNSLAHEEMYESIT